MNFIIEVADKVLNGGEVTRAEAERLINVSDDDTMLLLAMAEHIHHHLFAGKRDFRLLWGVATRAV